MASDQAAPVPAGWYPDPYKASELRWWDGQSWTDSIHPPTAPAPIAPPAARIPEPTPDPEPTPEPQPTVQPEPVYSAPVQDAPVESAPVESAPAQAFPAQTLPAFTEPVAEASPATPPLVEPPVVDQPAVATPAVDIAQPTVAPDNPSSSFASGQQLPSRREMRARASAETEASPAAPLSVPSVAATAFSDPVSAPASAVPDSATPTAFDWLDNGSAQASTQADSSPAESASLANPVAPVAPVAPSDPVAPAAPADILGFAPFTATPETPAAQEPSSASATGVDASSAIDPGALPVPASHAWAQDPSEAAAISDEVFSQPTTRKSTAAGWIIALSPLIGGFLAVGAVKGAENYPRYAPAGVEWWMLAGGVIAVLYIVTIVLAIADRAKLDWSGYNRPARWYWAILTAPVYLVMRTIAVKRETGKNSLLLWVWIACAAVLVGGWFAAQTFAPELIDGYTLPFI